MTIEIHRRDFSNRVAGLISQLEIEHGKEEC